jgi:hypothetical protein
MQLFQKPLIPYNSSNPSIRFPYRKAGTEKPHFYGNYSNHAQEYGCCGANRNCGFKCWRSYDSLHVSIAVWGFIPDNRLNFLKVPNLKPKLLCVGISKWAVWRNQWFVIWNYWLLMKWVCFVQIYYAMDYMMQTVRKKVLLLVRSSVVYWRFIAVATGNSGRRMAYA